MSTTENAPHAQNWRAAGRASHSNVRSTAGDERLAIRRELGRIAARRERARRHWRAALTGVALAAVLLTGLQAYAAQGIADARQAALDRAHLQVSAPR